MMLTVMGRWLAQEIRWHWDGIGMELGEMGSDGMGLGGLGRH